MTTADVHVSMDGPPGLLHGRAARTVRNGGATSPFLGVGPRR
jgi:hypothetical protein